MFYLYSINFLKIEKFSEQKFNFIFDLQQCNRILTIKIFADWFKHFIYIYILLVKISHTNITYLLMYVSH